VGFDITLTANQVFCIRQILEKNWECGETIHYLRKAYNSARREVYSHRLWSTHETNHDD
jgi:hypothetical protein